MKSIRYSANLVPIILIYVQNGSFWWVGTLCVRTVMSTCHWFGWCHLLCMKYRKYKLWISRNVDKYPNPSPYPCSRSHFLNFEYNHALYPLRIIYVVHRHNHIVPYDVVQVPIHCNTTKSIVIFNTMSWFGEEWWIGVLWLEHHRPI